MTMVFPEEMEGYAPNLKNRTGAGQWAFLSRSREHEPPKQCRKEQYRERGEEVWLARIRLVRLRGVKREEEKKEGVRSDIRSGSRKRTASDRSRIWMSGENLAAPLRPSRAASERGECFRVISRNLSIQRLKRALKTPMTGNDRAHGASAYSSDSSPLPLQAIRQKPTSDQNSRNNSTQ